MLKWYNTDMVEGAHSPEAGLQAHAQDLLDKFKTAVDAGKTQEAAQFAQELQGDEYTHFLTYEDFLLIEDALESARAAQEAKAQVVEEVVAAGEADDENDVSTTLEQQEVTQNGDDGENEFAASLKDIPELLELDISFDDAETKTTIGAAHQQATQIVDAIQHGQIQTKGTASARWNKQIGPPLQLLAAKYTSLIAAGDTEQANRVRAQRSRFLQVKQRIDAYFDAMKAAEPQEPAEDTQAPVEQTPEQAERSEEAPEIIDFIKNCESLEQLQAYMAGVRFVVRTFSEEEREEIIALQSARQEELRAAAEAQAPVEDEPDRHAEEPEEHPLGELAQYENVKALYDVISEIQETDVENLSLEEAARYLQAIREGIAAINRYVLGDGGELDGVRGRVKIEDEIRAQVVNPAQQITEQLNQRSRELLQADTDLVWQQLRAIIALNTATIPNDRFDGVIAALEGAIVSLARERAKKLDEVNGDEKHPKIEFFDEHVQQVKAKLEDVKERKASGIEQAHPGETELDRQKRRARKRVQEAWNNISRSEVITKGSSNNERLLTEPYVPSQDNIEQAGIYPLLEHFFDEHEEKMWRIMVDLHDAFNAAASQDVIKQMYVTNATESRTKAASHIDFGKMREFSKMPEVQPVFQTIHEIFLNPQLYRVVREKGKNQKWQVVPDDYELPDGIEMEERMVVHDYAKDGNPNSEEKVRGAVDVEDLLKMNHPDTNPAIFTSVQYLAVLSELRLKYYTPYYAGYTKTADGTFDTGIIAAHAPMAAILYKVRGYGKIPGKLSMMWQILRFPDEIPTNRVLADPKIKPKKSAKIIDPENPTNPNSTNAEYLPLPDDYDRIVYLATDKYPEVELVDFPEGLREVTRDEVGNIIATQEVNLSERRFSERENERDRRKYSEGKKYNLQVTRDPQTGKLSLKHRNVNGIPTFAFANNQVEEAMEVRVMQDEALTIFYDAFTGVRVGPDYSVFPFYWDIIFTHEAAISYAEYNMAVSKWQEFLDYAQNLPLLHKATDVDDILAGLVGKISPFKSVLGAMKGTPEGKRIVLVLQQILLRATKNLYDQYEAKAEFTTIDSVRYRTTKKGFFLQQAVEQFDKLKTMPGELSVFMRERLESMEGGSLPGGIFKGMQFYKDVFSNERGQPLSLSAAKFNLNEQTRRRQIVNQYTQEETPAEKKE